MNKQTFRKTLDERDFELANNDSQAVTENDWNVIGEFTVPPQQQYAYGFGSDKREANQGYLFVDLRDTADNDHDGTLRLVQEDANGLTKHVVYEEQADVLRGDKNDRQKKVPLPEQVRYPIVGEDSRMKIEFDPIDDSEDLSHDNSTVRVPVTVRT